MKKAVLVYSLLISMVAMLVSPGYFTSKAQASDAAYYSVLMSEMQGRGLPAGTFMFGDSYTDVINGFNLDVADPSWASKEMVDVDPAEGMPFDKAIKVTTTTKRPNAYEIDLTHKITTPVQKDDIFLTVVYFKKLSSSAETGTAESFFSLKNYGNGWNNWTYTPGNMTNGTGEWQKYYFTSAAPNDAGDNTGVPTWFAELQLGFQKQTVLIGGFATIKYPKDVDKSKLPASDFKFTYEGYEAAAPWRAEAAARIQDHRKGPIQVTVTDSSGNPVSGAKVQVNMKRHAFGFGSAVPALHLNGTTPADRIFQQKFYQLFNKATFENDLTWEPWYGAWNDDFGKQQVLNALPKLEEKGIPVKGHVLTWTGLPWHPDDSKNLQKIYESKAASEGQEAADSWMKETILAHIDDIAGTLKGRIKEWNVKNEPFNFRSDVEALGTGIYSELFNRAHTADPHAGLYMNESGFLQGQSNDIRDYLYSLVDRILADNARIDGVGEEGHYNAASLPSIPVLLNNTAEFGEKYPNLDLQITEFDINAYRPVQAQVDAQAQFTRDYILAMFSRPEVSAITSWGFWEGRHWYPPAAYYNEDWSLRPNGQAYIDTVFKELWTDEEGFTGSDGTFTTEGFLGDYDIIVTGTDKAKKVGFQIKNSNHSGLPNEIAVQLLADHTIIPGIVLHDSMSNKDSMYTASANLQVDASDADIFGGDTGRIAKNSPEAGAAVYRLKNVKSFAAAVYYESSDNAALSDRMKISLSPDGKVWAPAETIVRESAVSGTWKKAQIKQPGSIPPYMNYIRFEWPAGTAALKTQLADLTLATDETDNVFNDVKVDAIHDYFDDFSKVYSKSDGIITNESLFSGEHSKAIQLAWGNAGPESVVYDTSVLKRFDKFEVMRLHNMAGNNGTISYYASPDGIGWTQVAAKPTKMNDLADYTGTQYGYDLYVDTNETPIPSGMKYFKIEFSGGAEWAYRFAQVHLTGTAASTSKEITGFTLAGQTGETTIDAASRTITVHVPYGTDITALKPAVTVSEKAAVIPVSGEAVDFTQPVVYSVKAEDGSIQNWTTQVVVDPDATAPGVPGALIGTATKTAVTLNWEASTDNAGVVSYQVYQDQILLGKVSGTTLTYVVNDLKKDTDYRFRVTAADEAGNESQPAWVTVSTDHDNRSNNPSGKR
ncbi:endo-1,4-beta-xylanase [Paenibacillus gansuensis]|uniref:endo-1,4-beta-xylanase n=1 Tax=Paenibacillus gansuensis TaxID=306542 RepID=A0ABW5PIR7_9BACL